MNGIANDTTLSTANATASSAAPASANATLTADVTQPEPARRVLVIDDSAEIHADFRKILGHDGASADLAGDEEALFGESRPAAEGAGFQIDGALQGQEGHAKVVAAAAAGEPYQLAFVDMRMPPGWDGIQTIEKLWEADPRLQVVICSAYSAYSWEQIAGRLGRTDRLLILKKPFDKVEVLQIATALTAKWHASDRAAIKVGELEELVERRTAELRRSALEDRLTGLPNRELLYDRLRQVIHNASRDPSRKFAVLFVDFDRFKVVNDSLGHEIGDLLLIEIARRLRGATRTTDTLASLATAARLGGDEFVIVLDQLREYHDAARVTERLLQVLSEPYRLKGHEVHATASIGITTSGEHYTNPEDMIRDADTAMYRAKAAGKACYRLFDQQMHEDAVRRLTLEHDMRRAIDQGEFRLHYQPIVSLSGGGHLGFEALVRWQHPRRGLVPPLEFIPLAEEIGTIVPLGYWVLGEACRQLAAWRKSNPAFRDIAVSVNLSRKQLSAPDLVRSVARIVAEAGLRPADLKLEITEGTIMEDPEGAVRVLDGLRRLGVELHVDDFGTGYSSLSCLHRFPISGMKIDKTFVSHLGEGQDHALVTAAIISLAQKLNLRIVAEGVETSDQALMLRSMGCDLAQGYHFAKPLRPADAESFVATHPRREP